MEGIKVYVKDADGGAAAPVGATPAPATPAEFKKSMNDLVVKIETLKKSVGLDGAPPRATLLARTPAAKGFLRFFLKKIYYNLLLLFCFCLIFFLAIF